MSDSSLPRELQLIIDDIVDQNGHLLEWEMFGNTTEDMRAVLTWRRIEGLSDSKDNARWKLENSSGKKIRKAFGNGEDDDDDYVEEYWEEGDKAMKERARRARLDSKAKKNLQREKMICEDAQTADDRRKFDDDLSRLIKEENTILNEQKKIEEEKAKWLEEENLRLVEQKRLEEEKARLLAEENERLYQQRLREEEKSRLLAEENERLEEEKRLEEEREAERLRKLALENEEIDLNARVPHTKEEADRMFRMQRGKFSRSIDLAHLDDLELNKRFPRGIEYAVYGDDEYDASLEAEDFKYLGMVPDGHIVDPSHKPLFDADGNSLQFDDEGNLIDGVLEYDDDGNVIGPLQYDVAGNVIGPLQYDDDGNVIGPVQYDADGNVMGLAGAPISYDDEGTVLGYGPDGSGGYMMGPSGRPMYEGYDGKRIPYHSGNYKGYGGIGGLGSFYFGLYGKYDGKGPLPSFGSYGLYGGFMYNPTEMSSGYEYEYQGKLYQSRRIRKRKMKPRKIEVGDKRLGKPVFRVIRPCYNTKGWEGCVDCRYNDFCDNPQHKDEYIHMLFDDAKKPVPEEMDECHCTVCTGSAVHNGCFYRELLRLKTEYLVFDKYNYCFCSVCIPFKYRRMCLRQEFKLFRIQGADHYNRLTTNDGDDGIVRNQITWDVEDESEDDEEGAMGYGFMQAISLDEVKIDLTRDDKISFRDCPDCQCNGFCDRVRHKKIYQMLLKIDDEDFDVLQDECWCLVCEFKGAAHSGCAEREIRRLKYDLMLFDVRNLCYCHECVPFKYRRICLRQEMKMKRRKRNLDIYHHLYN